jgi:hypothetical protein
VTAVKVFTHPAKLLAFAEGNAQVLPSGQTVVGWGMGRRVSELGPDGELLFDVKLPGTPTPTGRIASAGAGVQRARPRSR